MSPRVQRAIVAGSTMMATFLVILDVTIANVALDHMRGSLSAAVDEITWVLTSFLVANAISLPITGWLSDLLGRKRLFMLATVAFTLTSAAAGAAPSLTFMVIARFLQGLAGGPLVPLSQATMIETFPARQRGMAMAIWGIGIMFAPIIGPTLGGWITDNWSWRWVFYINVPVGAAAVVLAWLFVPDSTTERPAVRRVDVPGLVLLVVGVSALQFVLCDIVETDGRPWACCPRRFLRDHIDGLRFDVFADLLFRPSTGPEPIPEDRRPTAKDNCDVHIHEVTVVGLQEG